MPKSLQSLLDARTLTASYRATPTLQEYVFTDTFYTNVRDVETDDFELLNYSAVNTPAPINSRGAGARALGSTGASKREGTLFHVFNERPLPVDCLHALREPESFTMQNKGEMLIEMEQEEFATRHRISKEVIIATILGFGQVDFDANGNPLRPTINPDGSITAHASAVLSANFGVSNTHRKEMDAGSSGYDGQIITSLWSNSEADIGAQFDRLKYRAEKNGVMKPTEVYINAVNKEHLRKNNEFRYWAQRNNVAIDAALRNDVLENLFGMNWHFVGGTYTDSAGTTHDLIPKTRAIITPPLGPWFRAVRGYELVPTTLDIVPDFRASLNSLQKIYGEFAYAQVFSNPARLSMFMGDNWGVMFADPGAIWMPDVFDNEGLSGSGQ